MKNYLVSAFAALAAAACITFAGCAAPGATPDAAQVQQIQTACAIDAGLRPTVTALLAIPGLATFDEVAAVGAARAVIDPICANPAGSVQANTIAAITSASAQLVGIVAQIEGRKNAAPK